ncbi:hypothetical protein JCM11641_007054, partial [Rhodosporidiobolus odoratus]
RFKQVPDETLSVITRILLQLYPKMRLSDAAINKRFLHAFRACKRRVHRTGDRLDRLLSHPQFYHPDFRAPIDDLYYALKSQTSPALPYKASIIARLTAITTFTLELNCHITRFRLSCCKFSNISPISALLPYEATGSPALNKLEVLVTEAQAAKLYPKLPWTSLVSLTIGSSQAFPEGAAFVRSLDKALFDNPAALDIEKAHELSIKQ